MNIPNELAREGLALPARQAQPIGSILLAAGKLKREDLERIVAYQTKHRVRFGEAAVRLRLVNARDLQLALSEQFDYPVLAPKTTSLSRELVAAFDPQSRTAEALRALRTQLMLRCVDADPPRRSFAVASAGRREGRSFLVANLAVVFSQLGERTLVIDADLRGPRQHRLFDVPNESGLSTVLAGHVRGEVVCAVPGFLSLSVLPAGATPPNPQELLGRGRFRALLREAAPDFDVVLIDTPPATAGSDGQLIAARADGAILLARGDHTRLDSLRQLAEQLRAVDTPILASILNDY